MPTSQQVSQPNTNQTNIQAKQKRKKKNLKKKKLVKTKQKNKQKKQLCIEYSSKTCLNHPRKYRQNKDLNDKW